MIISVVAAALIFGAGGFFGGMKYQQSKQPSFGGARVANGQFGQRGGSGANGANRNGFRPVNGQITSSDDKSITVKLQDGSSKIVFFSNSTVINKSATGSVSDLKSGEQVAVMGTDNSDGSVTAQNIQLNPIRRDIPSTTPTP